jgi:hypothetical protein
MANADMQRQQLEPTAGTVRLLMSPPMAREAA